MSFSPDKTPWIWQLPDWPGMRYDGRTVAAAVANARRAQGIVEGKLAALGFEQQLEITADSWTQEAVATAAIEGETLELSGMRSSIARRLGMPPPPQASYAPRAVEGLLDVMDDAVTRAREPLTNERLCRWQAALFPTGFSGMVSILVGAYRKHAEPMQIVSGAHGREKVHYEAPPSAAVPAEMQRLLDWVDGEVEPDSLVRAAVAHLWFETIHPFEDGNGRVGRAVADLILARDAGTGRWLIRLSQQIMDERKAYYAGLERTQYEGLDITSWVVWFVGQLRIACERAAAVIDLSLDKNRFWFDHRDKAPSARQRKVLNVLLDAGPDGFEGGMSSRKYASITSTSSATATRELTDLTTLGLLRVEGAGRSTRYQVNVPGWDGA